MSMVARGLDQRSWWEHHKRRYDAARLTHQPGQCIRPAAATAPVTVLILSVSAGSGHVRAAQALCAVASGLPVHAVHLDVMDFVPRAFRHVYTDLYVRMVEKYPHAWGCLYRYMQQAGHGDRVQALRRWVERRQARALLRNIVAMRPAAIVCTHFLPAELLAHLPAAEKLTCPIWVQVTDFDVHPIWIQPGVTGYFVGNEEVAFRLRDHGVSRAAIHVTGLPVMPAFTESNDRRHCARQLGLEPDRITVLLMGSAGVGNTPCIARRLLALDPALQLIVLTGRNVVLSAAMRSLASVTPERLLVHGHTTQVERFMACADLVVTKSGGLTSAECLVAGLPMVIHAPIPGQEERNADFLVEQGVAVKANDPVTVEFHVGNLLARASRLKKMAQSAREISRPDAAADVMRIVLARLHALGS